MTALPEPTYTAEEVDAALAVLAEPERLRHAQDVITHAAPGLQRILADALAEGGWFAGAHEAAVAGAASAADPDERLTAVRTLVAEETRLGMLVGAAVGFELARTLAAGRDASNDEGD